VQREIFGHKREEVAGRWRKLYNLELRSLTLHHNLNFYNKEDERHVYSTPTYVKRAIHLKF